MKRVLSQQEGIAIRNCHHDFFALTTEQAAQRMGVSKRRIQQLLQSAKQKVPTFFPILTARQNTIKQLINDSGLTFEQVAETLDISTNTVSSIVEVLKKKGVYLEKRKPTKPYESWMDSQIRKKF